MGLLTLLKRTAASVGNPSAGKASLFVDSASGLPSVKDESGAVTVLGGAAASSSTPTTIDADDAGAIGAGITFARADHQHGAATDTAVAIGAALAEGSAATLARADHVHTVALTDTQHGVRAGGTLHADATISTDGFQSAADKARQDNHARGWVNVCDFGADPTGAVSSETAITAAVAALPIGGIVFFPAGTYLTTSSPYIVSANQVTLMGSGAGSTTLKTANTTGDQLRITGYGAGIQDIQIQGPGTGTTSNKTTGIGLDIQGVTSFARNIVMQYQFDALALAGHLSDVEGATILYFKRSGIVVSHNSDHRVTRVMMNNNAATLPTGGGIEVTLTASLIIEQCNIIGSNFCLWLNPANGVTVPSVKATDCFFDTSAVGLKIDCAGSVFRSEFTNCWFSSMTVAGISMVPTGTGTADGITFVNCDIYNNVGGTTNGVITGTLTKKWKMVGCSIAGWTNGINLVAGANHFPTIMCNTIGAVSAFTANTVGILVGAGAYKGIVIAENDVVDNTTAFTLGAATVTPAGNYRIIDNAGINPRGTVTAPAGAPLTTVVYTNATGFRVIVFAKFGATAPTVQTVNGVSTVLPLINQQIPFPLEPGGTIAWTSTVMPTWTWVGQ